MSHVNGVEFAQGCDRSALDLYGTSRLSIPNKLCSEISGREPSENRMSDFCSPTVVEEKSAKRRCTSVRTQRSLRY